MPTSAPKPCTKAGCGVLVKDGSGRCPKHPKPVWQAKPTATKRITGRKLQALREQLFKSNPLCVLCEQGGRVSRATQRDHIVSLAEGGLDIESNTQGLCDECHDAKSLTERLRAQSRYRSQ